MSNKKWDAARTVHGIFTIFLVLFSLYLLFRSFYIGHETIQVYGTTDYYMDILKETEGLNFNTEKVADYMVYAYGMRKPGTDSNHTPGLIMERTEYFAMLVITQRLAQVSGENFGSDFDAWVERFASEEYKLAYKDYKKYRLKKGEKANPLERPSEQ